MKSGKLRKWDVTEHLKTEEDMALYFEACLEEEDAVLITAASGDIARVKGMNMKIKQSPAHRG